MKVAKIKMDMEEHIGTVVTAPNNTNKRKSWRHKIDVYEGYIRVCEYSGLLSSCVFENDIGCIENAYDLTYEDFLTSHMVNQWSCSMRDLKLYYVLYEFCIGRLTQGDVDVKVNEILKEEK